MNCDEFVELVTAYLEGALSSADRVEFERHLRECLGCERYLEQFRVTIDLLGELPPRSLSPEVRDRLLEAFSDWHRSRPHEP